MDFFSFEEDLLYHIDQAFVVVSSGLGTGFFQNPHVRDMLKRLNPRHRPMYPLKFLRLLRVICYVLNEEIMLLVKEAYLEYHSGFISSTSDFWWLVESCHEGFIRGVYCIYDGQSIPDGEWHVTIRVQHNPRVN